MGKSVLVKSSVQSFCRFGMARCPLLVQSQHAFGMDRHLFGIAKMVFRLSHVRYSRSVKGYLVRVCKPRRPRPHIYPRCQLYPYSCIFVISEMPPFLPSATMFVLFSCSTVRGTGYETASFAVFAFSPCSLFEHFFCSSRRAFLSVLQHR